MVTAEDDVSRILTVLSHPLRREILVLLNEKHECSFTDIMNALSLDTGKLSFHIRSLTRFLEQTPTGRYQLSNLGKNAIIFKAIKTMKATLNPRAHFPSLVFGTTVNLMSF